MKKLFILIVGVIAAIVALCMTGPLIGLAFSALLIYLGMHYYVKAKSIFTKILWVVVGLIGVFSAISNVPALIGFAALILVYVLYKKWNNEEVTFSTSKVKENDPFTNFENEWAKLTK